MHKKTRLMVTMFGHLQPEDQLGTANVCDKPGLPLKECRVQLGVTIEYLIPVNSKNEHTVLYSLCQV